MVWPIIVAKGCQTPSNATGEARASQSRDLVRCAIGVLLVRAEEPVNLRVENAKEQLKQAKGGDNKSLLKPTLATGQLDVVESTRVVLLVRG